MKIMVYLARLGVFGKISLFTSASLNSGFGMQIRNLL